ncbi:hypothetical protein GGF32_000087 [Allomyces javanicus]|nr:hypothetical protein GGF32_000087 [Allomyces javanicus]
MLSDVNAADAQLVGIDASLPVADGAVLLSDPLASSTTAANGADPVPAATVGGGDDADDAVLSATPPLLADDPNDADRHEQAHLDAVQQRRELKRRELLDKSKLPASYWANSAKEDRALHYVDNFRRQYQTLFPHRKDLFLTPENEFGVKKCVCTTIRPSQLGLKDLYGYRSCARFVADYVAYEPLDPPFELPTKLASPTHTLAMQSGNAFDMSVLLCSLLRGVGFEALVVSGYAARQITLMDETHVDTDIQRLMKEWEFDVPAPATDPDYDNAVAAAAAAPATRQDELTPSAAAEGKYKVKSKQPLNSKFLAAMEAKKEAEAKKLEQVKREQMQTQLEANDHDDEMAGLRIHAWVLVLPGKRDIAEAFFIEASTGKIYSLDDPKYLGVESVFSSTNYWVNMQKCSNGLMGISFDLADTTKWEFVFLQNPQPSLATSANGTGTGGSSTNPGTSGAAGSAPAGAEEEEDDGDAGDGDSELFDLPPSWVAKLDLSPAQFDSRCPSGSKVMTWRNVKLEIFAAYHRPDGMVARLTIFSDPARGVTGELHEKFANRKDKLAKRIRIPSRGLLHEFFERGRAHALQEHVMEHGHTVRMRFFRGARADGLYDRQESARKIIGRFEDREDRLVYRSVTHELAVDADDDMGAPGDDAAAADARSGAVTIVKMTEKYARRPGPPERDPTVDVVDPFMPPAMTPPGLAEDRDIYKRSFLVRDEKIRVVYHTDPGCLIPAWREFRKPSTEQKTSFMDLTTAFETRLTPTVLKKQHLYAKLCELLKAEQACLHAVKASDREIKEILMARQAEERSIQLVVSLFDTIRNKTDVASELEKENQKQAEEASKEASVDYLSPFLLNVGNPSALTRDEALTVRDACLKAMKERLVEKAAIIQRRYEEETAAYQRRQQQYSKNAEGMTPQETEEYVQSCSESLFRIHVLEKRLAKHKETAPEQYLALDRKLRADPRLARCLGAAS